jgi:hypothetical protein
MHVYVLIEHVHPHPHPRPHPPAAIQKGANKDTLSSLSPQTDKRAPVVVVGAGEVEDGKRELLAGVGLEVDAAVRVAGAQPYRIGGLVGWLIRWVDWLGRWVGGGCWLVDRLAGWGDEKREEEGRSVYM